MHTANNTTIKAKLKMEYGWLDGREDGEYKGIDLVEIIYQRCREPFCFSCFGTGLFEEVYRLCGKS